MKAAIYYGVQDLKVEELPIPTVGDHDILVKNLRAGICGTDIAVYNLGGHLFNVEPGEEFGHEMIGEVVEIGDKVSTDIALGMHVFVNPITAKKTGAAKSIAGCAFSQYILIEEAQLNYNIYEIDKKVLLEAAVLVEPMSVGTHGANVLQAKLDDRIVVFGAGPIGISAAASILAKGNQNVCIVDIDEWRLHKAATIGLHTLNTKKEDLADGLIRIFGSQINSMGQSIPNVDLYIDAAGAPALLQSTIAFAKPHSKMCIIAVYKKEISINPTAFMSNEFTLMGSRGYTQEDIIEVIDHLTEEKTTVATMVTQTFKLEDINEAFKVASEAKGTIKVIIDLT